MSAHPVGAVVQVVVSSTDVVTAKAAETTVLEAAVARTLRSLGYSKILAVVRWQDNAVHVWARKALDPAMEPVRVHLVLDCPLGFGVLSGAAPAERLVGLPLNLTVRKASGFRGPS